MRRTAVDRGSLVVPWQPVPQRKPLERHILVLAAGQGDRGEQHYHQVEHGSIPDVNSARKSTDILLANHKSPWDTA